MSEYIIRLDRLTDEGRAQFAAEHIELVRCRDCVEAKPTDSDGLIECNLLKLTFTDGHFCSWGVRDE